VKVVADTNRAQRLSGDVQRVVQRTVQLPPVQAAAGRAADQQQYAAVGRCLDGKEPPERHPAEQDGDQMTVSSTRAFSARLTGIGAAKCGRPRPAASERQGPSVDSNH
jgi:hypothetical protein